MIQRAPRGQKLSRFRWVAHHKLLTLYWVTACLVLPLGLYQFRSDDSPKPTPKPEFTDARKELHVVTRVGLNTYYETVNGPTGFEHELLTRFAKSIGHELIIHKASSLEEIFSLVQTGKVDFASAGLTPTTERQARFRFSEPYLSDQPLVVYKVGNWRPRLNSQLEGKDIVAVANSSHASALANLQQEHKNISWRETHNTNFFELLKRVEDELFSYVIIDESEFTQLQGFFPSLKRAMNLGDRLPVGWMFSKASKQSALYDQANNFISSIEENGELERLEEQFFGHSRHIRQDEAHEFAKNLKKRLPEYLTLIKQVAEEEELDWRLLAAISYQESRWNPRAKSPTGVRGMMMLTLTTAKEMGIENRLDVRQSLVGGSRYFLRLRENMPERIQEPDRTWFALAAYNVGRGHLEDARKLAQVQQLNPDSWHGVKQALPLLSDPEWHSRTRYGYARGYEPVHYVRQIRYYYNVITHGELANLLSIAENPLSSLP